MLYTYRVFLEVQIQGVSSLLDCLQTDLDGRVDLREALLQHERANGAHQVDAHFALGCVVHHRGNVDHVKKQEANQIKR